MKFNDLIGKTITEATQKKLSKHDDRGFLELKFSDGTKCVIIGGYANYTGESEDEYSTTICVVEDYYYDYDNENLVDFNEK